MIDEASIIPYTNNWKQTRANNTPQYIHTNKNGEFISGLIYHLDMVLNNSGNVFDELDKIVYKYRNNPYVKINKDEILQRYTQQINS